MFDNKRHESVTELRQLCVSKEQEQTFPVDFKINTLSKHNNRDMLTNIVYTMHTFAPLKRKDNWSLLGPPKRYTAKKRLLTTGVPLVPFVSSKVETAHHNLPIWNADAPDLLGYNKSQSLKQEI